MVKKRHKAPADDGSITVSSNGRRRGKLRLLTRTNLDQRTKAFQQFDSIACGIAQDLGGEDQLSTVQRHLVEAFAGIAISVNDINARLLLGQHISLIEHAQAVSTLVRVASRIGLTRVARNLTPTLSDYLRQRNHHADDVVEVEAAD